MQLRKINKEKGKGLDDAVRMAYAQKTTPVKAVSPMVDVVDMFRLKTAANNM